MAAILHLAVIPTSKNVYTKLIVLPDPENAGVAVYRMLHLYFRYMVAMFDVPVTPTSESIYSSLTVLMGADNVGAAVGFTLTARVQDLLFELQSVFPVLHLPFWFPV